MFNPCVEISVFLYNLVTQCCIIFIIAFYFFETRVSYIVKDGLKLEIFLSQPPRHWDLLVHSMTSFPASLKSPIIHSYELVEYKSYVERYVLCCLGYNDKRNLYVFSMNKIKNTVESKTVSPQIKSNLISTPK